MGVGQPTTNMGFETKQLDSIVKKWDAQQTRTRNSPTNLIIQ